MKKYTKGFTLIELLVVIAIIGILSSVVLVSLNSSRGKANATALRSTMASLRPAVASCNGDGLNSGTWGVNPGTNVCANEAGVLPTSWGGGSVANGAIAQSVSGTAGTSNAASSGSKVLSITVTGHSVAACNGVWFIDESSTTVSVGGAAAASPDTAGCR